ncbi:unnamed protein product [Adineta ricciae]|uniref:Uncharacterized protein n=1 Tax=Adineta ricciae TaxID=249248 RepID=A0A813Y6S2_ADIRI|nr:unnamed protein product [Adineta ricciae]
MVKNYPKNAQNTYVLLSATVSSNFRRQLFIIRFVSDYIKKKILFAFSHESNENKGPSRLVKFRLNERNIDLIGE